LHTDPSGSAVSLDYTISSGNVSLDLNAAKVTELINKSSANATLDLTTVSNASAVTLTKEVTQKLTAANLGIEAKLPQGTAILPAAVVKSVLAQAAGSSLTLEIKAAAPSTLNERQRAAVGNRYVADVSLSSAGLPISNLGGPITISLPYVLKAGEKASGIAVFYVDTLGNTQRVEGTYDPITRTANVITDHLSLYMVAYIADALPVVSSPTTWVNPYTDVISGAWYYDDIAFAAANKLFSGTTPTTFGPDEAMTRGMLVTVLARLAGADLSNYTATSFTDVAAGQYYAAPVEWAKTNNLVTGVGGSRFNPDGAITRQDLAVIILRYMNYQGVNPIVTQQYVFFSDEDQIADYAKNAIQTLNKLGIITGIDGNTIYPQVSATRAQVAAILHRFATALAPRP
jgi:hypothetical protein